MNNTAIVSNPGSASASAFTASVITLLMVEGRGCAEEPLRSDEKFGSTFASLDIQRAWLAYLCNIQSSYACAGLTIKRH